MNRYIIWLLLLPATALAELPVTLFHHIYPAGGKVGTSVEVEINASDWAGAKTLHFSHPGITASGSNKFIVAIASNVPPGIYEARISGSLGISNPRLFAVGLLNEQGKGTNAIAAGTVINGKLAQDGVEEFVISAAKNKPIIFRCLAEQIESRLEPVMVLLNPERREIARSRRGGILEFTPPETANYKLQLHDQLYRGGPDYYYRLEIGELPLIDSAIAGGRILLEGKNLPDVDMPAKEPFAWAMGIPALAGVEVVPIESSVLLKVPSAPLSLEHEENNTLAKVQRLLPPCEIRGTFESKEDVDYYQIQASKGDLFWVELVSHRIGEPTDGLLVIKFAASTKTNDVLELNDSEGNFGGPEFNTAHRDFNGRFEAKENGTYYLQLRNLFTPPENESPAYYLAIRKLAPGFSLAAMPNQPLPAKPDSREVSIGTTVFRKGETKPVKLVAFRKDGFNDEIVIKANNLPSGVTTPGAKIEAGKSSGLMFLYAAPDAPAGLINLEVTGAGGGIEAEAQPISLVRGVGNRNDEAVWQRFSSQFVGSVIEAPAAIRLKAETNVITAKAGSEVSISFLVEKQCELKAAFKMKPAGLPEIDQSKEVEVTPTSTNVVFKLNLAKPKLAPGKYVFALEGLASVKPLKDQKIPGIEDTSITLYSDPITLEITPEQLQAAAK